MLVISRKIRNNSFRRINIKNTKTCTKCGSENIIRIPGITGPYGSGNNIQTGITTLSAVKVTSYLCGECGFLEEWIDDKEDIKKIIKYYE